MRLRNIQRYVLAIVCLAFVVVSSDANAARRRVFDSCQQIRTVFFLDEKLPHFLQIRVRWIDNRVTARVVDSDGVSHPYMDVPGNGATDTVPFEGFERFLKKGENSLYITGINDGYPRGGHDRNPGRVDYVLLEDRIEIIDPRSCEDSDNRSARAHEFFTHRYFFFFGPKTEWLQFKRSQVGRRLR